LKFSILDSNIQNRINQDLKNSEKIKSENLDPEDYPFDVYLNGDQYNEWLQFIIRKYEGDHLISKNFGKSYEGRDIIGILLKGKGESCHKPTIAVDCGLHSCEWISPGNLITH